MSTISTEERREAAKELRKLTTPGCIRYAEEFYEELREIVASDLDGSFEGVANSLADLIDRTTCRNNGNHDDRHFWCSRCGYEAWTYDDSGCDPSNFSFCPDCGAEVVDDARI